MTVTDTTASADALRRRMTTHLADEGVLRSASWRRAFTTVPREHFVPAYWVRTADGPRTLRSGDPGYLETVYSDTSLITRRDAHGVAISSSTQPRVMAAMLEALPERDTATVLEIGTGTGYNAALLCARYGAGQVVSLDLDPELTDTARTRLHTAGYTPTLVTGDGTRGHTPHAPYSAIIATCGLPRIPAAWLPQLEPGGTLVANLGHGLAALQRQDDNSLSGRFLPEMAAFMTARRAPENAAPASRPQDLGRLARATGRTTTVPVPAEEVTAPMPRFLAGVLHHDTIDVTLTDDDGRATHLIQHPATGAWARLTPHGPHNVRLDYDGPGHRSLWDGRLALIAAWAAAGRPGPDRYGLTVTPDGSHTLYLDTPHGPSWPLPA